MTGPDARHPTPITRRDGSPSGSWSPARGYRWAPFEKGNLVSVKHGADSERLVDAQADDLHAALVEVCPWVTDLDAGAVRRYCRAEARAVLLSDYVSRVAAEQGPECVPVTVWDSATRADLAADKLSSSLGLTPESRARLLKDVGQAHHYAGDGLDAVIAHGQEVLARRQADAITGPDPEQAS